jgi:MYND finger
LASVWHDNDAAMKQKLDELVGVKARVLDIETRSAVAQALGFDAVIQCERQIQHDLQCFLEGLEFLESALGAGDEAHKHPSTLTCQSCNDDGKEMFRCRGCTMAVYCSDECQKRAAPEHAHKCAKIVVAIANVKAALAIK